MAASSRPDSLEHFIVIATLSEATASLRVSRPGHYQRCGTATPLSLFFPLSYLSHSYWPITWAWVRWHTRQWHHIVHWVAAPRLHPQNAYSCLPIPNVTHTPATKPLQKQFLNSDMKQHSVTLGRRVSMNFQLSDYRHFKRYSTTGSAWEVDGTFLCLPSGWYCAMIVTVWPAPFSAVAACSWVAPRRSIPFTWARERERETQARL